MIKDFFSVTKFVLSFAVSLSALFAYIMANLTAASLVLVSLINAYNQASALIQITWVCISLYGLARLYSQKRRLVFSPE